MPEIFSAVVGTKFRGSQAIEAIAKMRPGDAVQLVREADNAFDRNAVACHYLGVHVGYVPRQANPTVAAAMDGGATPTATVDKTPLFSRGRIEREPLLTISWGDEVRR